MTWKWERGWWLYPSHSVCFPFTEPGLCMNTGLFSSAHTERKVSGPWGDILWIWQKMYAQMYWVRISDYTFNTYSIKQLWTTDTLRITCSQLEINADLFHCFNHIKPYFWSRVKHIYWLRSVYLNYFFYILTITAHLLQVFSIPSLTKSAGCRRARNRHCSETSILSTFSTKIQTPLFALPHLNEPPTCLFLSSHPCTVRSALDQK